MIHKYQKYLLVSVSPILMSIQAFKLQFINDEPVVNPYSSKLINCFN